MLKSCSYCGRIHEGQCQQKPERRQAGTNEARIRSSRKWDKARKRANERDHYLCRLCLERGVMCCEGLETHHIVPLAEDDTLAYDDDNLITLCVAHHKAAEQGEFSREALKKLACTPPHGVT